MIIPLSRATMSSVPRRSSAKAEESVERASTKRRLGRSQALSTCQSMRDRVSL